MRMLRDLTNYENRIYSLDDDPRHLIRFEICCGTLENERHVFFFIGRKIF